MKYEVMYLLNVTALQLWSLDDIPREKNHMTCTNCDNSAHQNRLIIASVCLRSLRWAILGSDLHAVDKAPCCQLLQWVRFHQ